MTTTPADELPKLYDHAAAQRRWSAFWREKGYFHAEPPAKGQADPTRGPFTIVIPPPNVTGALHLGHALNNTLQDILIRWRRMQGYNALWMPGTDHAGIATQAVVERRLLEEEKQTRHDLGREKLVERIWQWKEQYEARILAQLSEMGCSCDWERTRFTLDDTCARAVRETFFRLFREGLIFRGKRMVNWDTFLQTAVSDDEVYHESVKGHFWHIRYPVDGPLKGEPEHVTVATTRPETMLGDTAVAVHPDPAAALDKIEAELKSKLATATAKEKPEIEKELEALAERRRTHLLTLVKLRDMAKAGRKLILPLTGRKISLICDEWAKPELGSGCVKITPAHDPNDNDVWQRHQEIGAINIMNPDGTLADAVPEKYRGLTMKKAREAVVADLEAAGLLAEVEDREIDLAHSDRSKTPIEPYLADQWFVKMSDHENIGGLSKIEMEGTRTIVTKCDNDEQAGLAQTAMDAVIDGRVKIVPERYSKGYLDWLREKRDWPVSRQLWWGHRIPVWSKRFNGMQERRRVEASAKEIHFAEHAKSEDEDRCAFWMEWNPENIEGVAYFCLRDDDPVLTNTVEAAGFAQDPDVLDTWFSSALWPHSTLGWPEETPELEYFYPTSTLITSRDIITLWVARMVLMSLHNVERDGKPLVPFREVFIHPKILDGYGETMSKSKGNGVDPLDVIEKFGADALRFALAYLTTETQDVRMPVEFECPHCQALVEQTKKNRLLARIKCPKCGQDFATQWATRDEDKALPRAAVVSERFELGRNFCTKLWNASRFALMNLEGYTPAAVADEMLETEDRWLLSRLSTVTTGVTAALGEYRYADAARLLYDFAWDEFCSFYIEMAKGRLQDPAARPTAQRVLAHALDVLLRLLHPMMPFLTEEIWQRLGDVAKERGLDKPRSPAKSIVIAPWPEADAKRQDPQIERRFSRFQEMLRGLREIRARQNIPPRETMSYVVKCHPEIFELLQPMESYIESMAGAKATAWGPDVTPPLTTASFHTTGTEVYVDIGKFIDVDAEIARLEKERDKLAGLIDGKQKKLANETFTARAPADVVAAEREKLAQYEQETAAIIASLAKLRK